MNTDSFIINEKDIEYSHYVCRSIQDEDIRNRAVASALGANIAATYFDKDFYNVDVESGLHNIAKALEEYDISDIYINGNYIDVRLYFEGDKLVIPQIHIDKGILPVAYMFIKIEEDLSYANVTGFISTEMLNGKNVVDESELVSFYDIETLFSNKTEENIDDTLIFDYLSNKLDNTTDFYKALFTSKTSRLKLQRAALAEETFKYISVAQAYDNNIYEDSDLNTSFPNDLEMSLDDKGENLLLEESPLTLDLDENVQTDLENFIPVNPTDDLQLSTENDTLSELSNTDENLKNFDSIQELQDEFNITESSDNVSIDLFKEETKNDDITKIMENNSLQDLSLPEDTEQSKIDSENASQIENDSTRIQEEADNIDKSNELTSIDYSTEVIKDNEEVTEKHKYTSVMNSDGTQEVPDDTLETLLEEDSVAENIQAGDSTDNENTHITSDDSQELVENEESKQLDDLFPTQEENTVVNVGKKSPKFILPILLILAIIAGGGYLGYTKLIQNNANVNNLPDVSSENISQQTPLPKVTEPDAMPVETVENTKTDSKEEAVSGVSIPAIEKNLDASVVVSNLKLEWEIPAGYVSNTAASRYLQKLGKIIQLNLKTELLLLNKPPLTNKITVEIQYNNDTKKFETSRIIASSGEQSVDDLILKTVSKALDMKLSSSTDSFGKIQGNPILIIKL